MPTLSDFEFVVTGGNVKPGKPLVKAFKSESRTGDRAYLLVEIYTHKTGPDAQVELKINKKPIGTLSAAGGQAVHVVGFAASILLPLGPNRFEASVKNASATFAHVICHFHQKAESSFLPG